MKAPHIFAFATVLVTISKAPGFAADPIGIWNAEQGTVRVSDCGGALCATLASLKQPADPQTGRPKTDIHNPDVSKRNRPLVGVVIFSGMQPQGPNRWGGGRLYNPEDGNSYDASFTLEGANVLKVQGCVMVICKSRTWTR
jgi:uncharacterized protein (DUF2147 family)